MVDSAPTLAQILGVDAPAGCDGKVLDRCCIEESAPAGYILEVGLDLRNLYTLSLEVLVTLFRMMSYSAVSRTAG